MLCQHAVKLLHRTGYNSRQNTHKKCLNKCRGPTKVGFVLQAHFEGSNGFKIEKTLIKIQFYELGVISRISLYL